MLHANRSAVASRWAGTAAAAAAQQQRRAVVVRAASSERLQQVLKEIDALNAQDPRTTVWQGQELPYELA